MILYAVGNSTDPNQNEFTLEDNTFSDITFTNFVGYGIENYGIEKIHTKAFNKTADKINYFYCIHCEIVESSPEYDIQMVINQFTQLKTLMIGLDVDVIPSNAIVPFNGHQSELILLSLKSKRNNFV